MTHHTTDGGTATVSEDGSVILSEDLECRHKLEHGDPLRPIVRVTLLPTRQDTDLLDMLELSLRSPEVLSRFELFSQYEMEIRLKPKAKP